VRSRDRVSYRANFVLTKLKHIFTSNKGQALRDWHNSGRVGRGGSGASASAMSTSTSGLVYEGLVFMSAVG
jgi:hypothetical protein